MVLLGMDLGGTKLAAAVFNEEGTILHKEHIMLGKASGKAAGQLIGSCLQRMLYSTKYGTVDAVGIAVPGIFHQSTGTVWAPNIAGWTDYPLLEEARNICKEIPVTIDSDRACYILGESWQGNAKQQKHAIFLSVGTGIGAGILVDGQVLRGAQDIAGAIGWMALQPPFSDEYLHCGCFENYASGEGIANTARKMLMAMPGGTGPLYTRQPAQLTALDVFEAYKHHDPVAMKVIGGCIEFWGMATANLVSLFNPEKIIFGGGVFGPAIPLIPGIEEEARKWAQPVSMKQVVFEPSALGNDAGVYGAGWLARKSLINKQPVGINDVQ